MSQIVVLGAGLGSVITACEMKDELGPDGRLTAVDLGTTCNFVPSAPWGAVGWRERTEFPVDPTEIFARRVTALRIEGTRGVYPSDNRTELRDGSSLHHDHLILATGLAFDEVEGLGPSAYAFGLRDRPCRNGAARFDARIASRFRRRGDPLRGPAAHPAAQPQLGLFRRRQDRFREALPPHGPAGQGGYLLRESRARRARYPLEELRVERGE